MIRCSGVVSAAAALSQQAARCWVPMSQSSQNDIALRRYRKLVDNLPNSMVYIVDRERCVVFAGGGLVRTAGVRTDLHIGRRLAELVPETLALIAPYLEATFAGQETSFELAMPSGRIYLVHAAPLQDDEDSVTEVLMIGQEISERKQALKTLAENEARYRSLFENNSSVMLLIDPTDGAILDANKSAETYYGWTQAQLGAMNVFQIDTGSFAQVEAEAASAVAEGRSYYVLQHRLANGALRDV